MKTWNAPDLPARRQRLREQRGKRVQVVGGFRIRVGIRVQPPRRRAALVRLFRRIREVGLKRPRHLRLLAAAHRTRVFRRRRHRKEILNGRAQRGHLVFVDVVRIRIRTRRSRTRGFLFRSLLAEANRAVVTAALFLVQLLENKPLERLNPPREALIEPRLELVSSAFDETERRGFADLTQRAKKVQRLNLHRSGAVRAAAARRRLRQRVRQKRELARQTKLSFARVTHEHARAQTRDERRAVVRGEVELFEPRSRRVQNRLDLVIELWKRARGRASALAADSAAESLHRRAVRFAFRAAAAVVRIRRVSHHRLVPAALPCHVIQDALRDDVRWQPGFDHLPVRQLRQRRRRRVVRHVPRRRRDRFVLLLLDVYLPRVVTIHARRAKRRHLRVNAVHVHRRRRVHPPEVDVPGVVRESDGFA
eukprot:29760-Pelagococcus_subviridis.AAC.5